MCREVGLVGVHEDWVRVTLRLGLHFHGRTGAVIAFMHPWVSVCGINLDWDTSINAV